jgi:hypothetical protein
MKLSPTTLRCRNIAINASTRFCNPPNPLLFPAFVFNVNDGRANADAAALVGGARLLVRALCCLFSPEMAEEMLIQRFVNEELKKILVVLRTVRAA